MNYSIIGTGNVAWFFAKRLKEAGHNCMGIYGRMRVLLLRWLRKYMLMAMAL